MTKTRKVSLVPVDVLTAERYPKYAVDVPFDEVRLALPIMQEELAKAFPEKDVMIAIEDFDRFGKEVTGKEIFEMMNFYMQRKLKDPETNKYINTLDMSEEHFKQISYSETIIELLKLIISKSNITRNDIKDRIKIRPIVGMEDYIKRDTVFHENLKNMQKITKKYKKVIAEKKPEPLNIPIDIGGLLPIPIEESVDRNEDQ